MTIPNTIAVNTWLAFLTPLCSAVLIVLQLIKNRKLNTMTNDLKRDMIQLSLKYNQAIDDTALAKSDTAVAKNIAASAKNEADVLKTQIGQINQTNQPLTTSKKKTK